MGRVFLAQDLKNRRPVALKVLRPDLAASIATERFLREIEIAANLAHPLILPLHDSGSEEGFLYYVMPYIEGESLRDRITREGELPLSDVFQIAADVSDALDYAHNRGVVHRDIKPENILLTAGHAVVADFGIARAAGEAGAEALTATGVALGTPAYMSPEQAGGGSVDGRSDLYALGCVIYEVLAGRPPFTGPNAQAVLLRHLHERPPRLRSARPTLPGHVVRAVDVALAKSPADRFRSAAAFREALTGSHPVGWLSVPRVRWWWWRAASIAAIAVATTLGVVWARDHFTTRFHDKDWILVADFDGPSDDPGLVDAVRELTTAELNQSSFLSTLPRQQLDATMQLANVPETTHVGPELARELAYRSAVRAVLVGSIARVGSSRYSIVLHVLDAEDGKDILSISGPASDSDLVDAVQLLGRRVREGLGELRTSVEANQSLEQVATPSFAAYRRYVEGVKLQDQGDGAGSNRVLREALALDTGFASAWYVMGWNYINDRMLDSAKLAFAEAIKRPDRLGIPRRYRVEADAAYVMRYDIPTAIRAYDLYLDHFPRAFIVLNNRGLYQLALGRYEDALQDFQQAVAVQPFGRSQAQIPLANQVATLITLGRLSDARGEMQDLTGPFAKYDSLMLQVATDDWSDAESTASLAAEAPSSPNWLRVQAVATAASAVAARGAIRAADSQLAHALATGTPETARFYGLARLLLAQAAGRSAPPLPSSYKTDVTPSGLITYGIWAAASGDTIAARRRLQRALQSGAADLPRLGYGPDLLAASIAAQQGRWADVVRVLGPAAVRGEHDSSMLDRVSSLSIRWLVADAYAQLGRMDSAVAAMELELRPMRMPGSAFALRGFTFPFAHARLARWYAAMGRPLESQAHWRVVISSLTTPDVELRPLVAAAHQATQG